MAVTALTATSSASAATFGIMTFGENANGQLGNGANTLSAVPVEASKPGVPSAISAGGDHSLAITNGTVAAWGANAAGQLGTGNTNNSNVPVPVCTKEESPCKSENVLKHVVAVAAGGEDTTATYSTAREHSLALLENGTVVAWGSNNDGELGNHTTTNSDVPVVVCAMPENPCQAGNELKEVVAIAAGDEFSLALLKNGTVVAWGNDNTGELGNGGFGPNSCEAPCGLTPAVVPHLTEVTAISAGNGHSMALRKDGTVWTWGYNYWLQLGRSGPGPNNENDPNAGQVPGLSEVAAISAGGWHSVALLNNGTVKAWGENFYGQNGKAASVYGETPTAITGLSEVQSISAGEYDTLAVLRNGTVMGVGNNEDGELGNGKKGSSHQITELPVQASNLTGATAVAAGYEHTLAIERRPQFSVNGNVSIGSEPAAVVFGEWILENKLLGKLRCRIIADTRVRNESTEKAGTANIESFTTPVCKSEPHSSGTFVSAETSPVAHTREETNSKGEKVTVLYASRGSTTLPWLGQLVEGTGEELPEARLRIHGVTLTWVSPSTGAEVTFEGTLEPSVVNGARNGLSPSHLEFAGASSTSGFIGRESGLTARSLPTTEGDNILYVRSYGAPPELVENSSVRSPRLVGEEIQLIQAK
jgi:alpha-tubulin suppressor-like RCC1 family protein